MNTAAVFMSGNSQAVRLPKAFQFKSKRVYIERRGEEVVLRDAPVTMGEILAGIPAMPDWPLYSEGSEGADTPVEPI